MSLLIDKDNDESNRLVYVVEKSSMTIISCRYHY
ncbi:MAG: type II toxin-antitoxin system YoeB family toxin [Halomonadaceae bacterium]|nr:type II toxin-antitoxin system YoeB family toxin [Halomonadaceae bacterium]